MMSLRQMNNGFGFDISHDDDMKGKEDARILAAMGSVTHRKEIINAELLGYA